MAAYSMAVCMAASCDKGKPIAFWARQRPRNGWPHLLKIDGELQRQGAFSGTRHIVREGI